MRSAMAPKPRYPRARSMTSPSSMNRKECEAGDTATRALHARGVCRGKANALHGSAETAAFALHFTVIRSAIVHKTPHSHSDATAQTIEGHVIRLAQRSLSSPGAGIHLPG
ncbi:hypothetical protein CNECB9_4920030 [Cupriavidus necator]|uniref:Uncharacterized protein n=1 Tax=Cupriavidus necator TaxID=106590 RepID=A0A1K0IN42_CUPNE|nr:hypothetical protein CNECB9_4920030 [Cupriavidus necator]